MSAGGMRGGAGGECGGNAAPYVLGALPPEDHEAFLRHLRECAVCREEVAALQVAVTALPSGAPAYEAPPQLKRRVMAAVNEDARRVRAAERGARLQALRGRLAWRPVIAPLALGAAAVLALLAIVLSGGGSGGSRAYRAQVTAPGASASVEVSDGHAQLTLTGMPQAPAGRIYEVWLKRAGAPAPTAALFSTTAGGAASVGVPGDLAGVREILVTSEPLGGSRVPTTAPLVVARLS